MDLKMVVYGTQRTVCVDHDTTNQRIRKTVFMSTTEAHRACEECSPCKEQFQLGDYRP